MYDVNIYRNDFPILGEKIYNQPLVYFDNGATTQKPHSVVEAMANEYYTTNANVHRGVHFLSQKATELYEDARETVKRFINAGSTKEIIFTRGTTESLNLFVNSFSEAFLNEGDEVLVSTMEHHSNIVPWQMLAARKGITIKVIPINEKGEIELEEYKKLFSSKTRVVSVTHVSNVLGTVNPIRKMIQIAHEHNVPFMVDGAQSVPHFPVDVQKLDADFMAFSGHKVYGPTGIGVFYGKQKYLEQMPPYQGGGEMIQSVSFEKTVFNELPYKFEAGTPDYVAAVGLKKALDYVSAIGMDKIETYENALTEYALEEMKTIPGMRIFGESAHRSSVISFLVGNIHHLDMGTLLDQLGIAVRTGHHCAQPVMIHYGIEGTVRASFGLYNTEEEVDRLVKSIRRVCTMFH